MIKTADFYDKHCNNYACTTKGVTVIKKFDNG